LNTATRSTEHDAVDETRSVPPRQESAVVASLANLDGLAVDELRTMPPEELQILAATGC
jgi:hypothetical protein